jgi:hypothetical protein
MMLVVVVVAQLHDGLDSRELERNERQREGLACVTESEEIEKGLRERQGACGPGKKREIKAGFRALVFETLK